MHKINILILTKHESKYDFVKYKSLETDTRSQLAMQKEGARGQLLPCPFLRGATPIDITTFFQDFPMFRLSSVVEKVTFKKISSPPLGLSDDLNRSSHAFSCIHSPLSIKQQTALEISLGTDTTAYTLILSFLLIFQVQLALLKPIFCSNSTSFNPLYVLGQMKRF